jgi:hypothetical protein
LVWSNQGLNPRFTALEASRLNITPLMQFWRLRKYLFVAFQIVCKNQVLLQPSIMVSTADLYIFNFYGVLFLLKSLSNIIFPFIFSFQFFRSQWIFYSVLQHDIPRECILWISRLSYRILSDENLPKSKWQLWKKCRDEWGHNFTKTFTVQ